MEDKSQDEVTVIRGPSSLRYPITVTSIDAAESSDIQKFQPVFTFKFTGTAIESQDDGSDKEVPRIFVETFDSPIEGKRCHWLIKGGQEILDSR